LNRKDGERLAQLASKVRGEPGDEDYDEADTEAGGQAEDDDNFDDLEHLLEVAKHASTIKSPPEFTTPPRPPRVSASSKAPSESPTKFYDDDDLLAEAQAADPVPCRKQNFWQPPKPAPPAATDPDGTTPPKAGPPRGRLAAAPKKKASPKKTNATRASPLKKVSPQKVTTTTARPMKKKKKTTHKAMKKVPVQQTQLKRAPLKPLAMKAKKQKVNRGCKTACVRQGALTPDERKRIYSRGYHQTKIACLKAGMDRAMSTLRAQEAGRKALRAAGAS
jgi:hypothetical protein